jgi:tripartite-type tricarboxylate transporter receptor subunit TctC
LARWVGRALTSFPINPNLYKLNFDALNGFASVILASIPPLILFVHTGVPAKNVSELIELTKSTSPQINFANSGTGTTAHLAGELFNRMAGTQMSSINYRGGGPAVTDLLGGMCRCTF